VVYDCLFPCTVGGAERWYRNIAERLAADGHEVTYLTRRQWDRHGGPPAVPGVRVIAVSGRSELYTEHGGRRRILPPLAFGLGCGWHLARRGRDYDVVHTASFPYFSLLAAAAARRRGGYRLVVDWHEVWSEEYWREYLGGLGGRIGALIQRACASRPHRAFCFSELHAARLRREGHRGPVTVLRGEYAGSAAPSAPASGAPVEPVVVFAGRHISEKQVPAIVPALAAAREVLPGLRAEIYGDGPERPKVGRLVASHELRGAVHMPGFVPTAAVEAALERAMCLVLPSKREGYGLVVVEAAARGTPSVVVKGPDNAAVELVSEGENGVVAPSAEPQDLAAAILAVHAGGSRLRAATAAWYERNATMLSLESSVRTVLAGYAEGPSLTHTPRRAAGRS